MTLQEYKDNIEVMLGAPLLDLELDSNHLEKIIKVAFLEIKDAIDTPHYQTFPVAATSIQSGYDLSEYNVRAVLYVMRGTINWMNATENTDALLWSPLTMMMTQSQNIGYNRTYSQMDFLQDFNATLRYRQLRNSLNQDLDFTFDFVNQKLYIFQQIPQVSQLTIVYNKQYGTVDEINDPFWIKLMLRLALAYVKQVLGRIRGKYRMTSAPYELDADTLLQEAATEISDIHTFLAENNNIFIPRD
jgi:hypothetical protein